MGMFCLVLNNVSDYVNMDLPYLQPVRLFFSTFDEKILKEISVKCITNPTSLDRVGTPLTGKIKLEIIYNHIIYK